MFQRRKSRPALAANLKQSMDVENIITRLDAAADRFDVVYERLLPVIDALTVQVKRGGNGGATAGLAH